MRAPIISGDTVIWVEADTAEALYAAVAAKIQGVVVETDDGLVVEQSGFRHWALREVARLESEAQRATLRPGDLVIMGVERPVMPRPLTRPVTGGDVSKPGDGKVVPSDPFQQTCGAIENAKDDGEIVAALAALAEMP
jgi:hypothetical protein